jgi:hypothetical protein
LVAGYLWVTWGWLLLEEPTTGAGLTRLEHRITDLAHVAGPTWTAIAVGVGAYLVGLISRDISRIFTTVVRQVRSVRWEVAVEAASERRALRRDTSEDAELHREPTRTARRAQPDGLVPLIVGQIGVSVRVFTLVTAGLGASLVPGLERFAVTLLGTRSPEGRLSSRVRFSLDQSDPIVRQLVEARAREAYARIDLQGSPASAEGSVAEKLVDQALADLTEGLRRELDLPATLLVGEQPELYAEADRVRAESELRIAVVPPLMALAILLSSRVSLLWLLALVPTAQLLIQGVRREDDARRLIGSALLFGNVESAAVKRFDVELTKIFPSP